MTIELYQAPQSTCSQKVRITLAEKGMPERGKDWVERFVDLSRFQQLEPEYLKLNPNGVVPTFVHDGTVLIESSAILEYLDEVFPEPPLLPPNAADRARARAWMRYIDEVPTVAVRVPTFANMLAPMRFSKTDDTDFAKHAERLPLRKQFYQRMSQKGFGKAELEYAEFQIRQTCERIDQAIRESGGPWIMGAQYTMVDAQVTPLIDRMEDLGFAFLWEDDLPQATAWLARVQARPSYAAAFYPGARISQTYPDFYRPAAELKAERGY
jgi:glutathione S-transferase